MKVAGLVWGRAIDLSIINNELRFKFDRAIVDDVLDQLSFHNHDRVHQLGVIVGFPQVIFRSDSVSAELPGTLGRDMVAVDGSNTAKREWNYRAKDVMLLSETHRKVVTHLKKMVIDGSEWNAYRVIVR